MSQQVNIRQHSQPQRLSGASVALITRKHGQHREWLLQWNPTWQAMNLIGGTRETTDANDLTCLVREIHEELFTALSAQELCDMQTILCGNNDRYCRTTSLWQDAYIETMTRIGNTPFECEAISLSAKCLTHYTFHIYKVTLHADVPFFHLASWRAPDAHSAVFNEWASLEKIQCGATAQGHRIGKTVEHIVNWVQSQPPEERGYERWADDYHIRRNLQTNYRAWSGTP